MAITPLTVYSVPQAATTLTTAEKLISVGGGAQGAVANTKIGTTHGWGEVVPLGTTAAWAGAGSMPAQSGNGLLFDTTLLEGQEIVAVNNFVPSIYIYVDTLGATITADVAWRFSIRSSSGVYTTIGTITLAAQTIQGATLQTVLTGTATNFGAFSFNAGDKLYVDVFLNITAGNIAVTAATNITWSPSNSTTAGWASSQFVTPGYIPIPANNLWTTVDSAPATDVGPGLQSSPIDAFPLIDATTFTDAYSMTDSGTATDSLLVTGTDLAIDRFPLADIGPGLQSSPIDLLLGSDSVAYTASYNTTESQAAVDSVLTTDSYTSSDSTPGIDATTITQLKALTLFPLNSQPTATLATASSIASALGGTLGATTTALGTASGYGELWPEGNAAAWAAGASIAAPTGHGWLYDTASLEGAQFFAENWQPTLTLSVGTGGASITADVYFRVYKRSSSGVYTLINSFVALAQAIALNGTVVTFTAARLPTQNLAAVGDKIYTDCMLNITNPSLLGTATIGIQASNVAGKGTTDWQTFTPGYTVAPPVVTNNLWTTVDSFPATDVGPGLQAWLVEIGLGSDSLLVIGTDLFTDTASATDVGPGLQSWGIDNGLASDNLVASTSYIPTEALRASDSLLASGAFIPSDVAPASDTYSAQANWLPIDTQSASDSLLASAGYSTTDAGRASDSYTVQSLYSSTDTLLPIDATTYTDTYNATDAQSVADSMLYSGNPMWIDLATASDALLVAESYTSSDATSAVDIGSLQSWLVEFGLASDSIAYSGTYSPTDIILASDPLVVLLSSSFSDMGIGGDLSSLQSWLVEIGFGSDSLFVVGNFVPVDLMLASDSLLVTEMYSTIDSVLPNDSQSIFVSTDPVYSYITVQAARGTLVVRGCSGAITVQGARGTIAAKAATGTITVQGSRGTVTAKGE